MALRKPSTKANSRSLYESVRRARQYRHHRDRHRSADPKTDGREPSLRFHAPVERDQEVNDRWVQQVERVADPPEIQRDAIDEQACRINCHAKDQGPIDSGLPVIARQQTSQYDGIKRDGRDYEGRTDRLVRACGEGLIEPKHEDSRHEHRQVDERAFPFQSLVHKRQAECENDAYCCARIGSGPDYKEREHNIEQHLDADGPACPDEPILVARLHVKRECQVGENLNWTVQHAENDLIPDKRGHNYGIKQRCDAEETTQVKRYQFVPFILSRACGVAQ
jgi:hypothetical protein